MRYFTLIILSILSFTGCKIDVSSDEDVAYFGGEIINPKGSTVIFYNHKEATNDTLTLDKNNRFINKLNAIKPGVYTFRHGGEIQFVIIEPNDSIMIRLNTYDFDESLVFTGNGARKNNYLIETFLSNEKEAKRLVKYSKKDPEVFEEYITNRYNNQLNKFNLFIENKPISDFAASVIKSTLDYHHYADKEIYPFAYFGKNKMVHIKDLPENFYAFRSEVNYNENEFSELFAYNRFLFSHFNNLALSNFYKNKPYHSEFNRYELNYNKAKLEIVDSLVQDETIKNRLLKFKTRDFISHCENKNEVDEIMASYLSKSTSEEDIKYMNSLIASLNNLKPGKGLPELKVINLNNKEFTIAEIVDKPTLIYFWSSNYKQHYKNSHKRVKELKAKFPKMAFMSININDNADKYWKETLQKYKFDLANEYRFKNPKEALKTLAVNYVYKVFIVDKKANIVHPNVNIFSDNFESTLKTMVQKKELVFH